MADRSPTTGAAALAEALYADWYLGLLDGIPEDPPLALGPIDLDLADLLQEAHVDARRWEHGWTVNGVSSQGRVAVARNGRRRVLARVDVLPVARVCLPPRPGDAVRVVARRDALDRATSFWFTYGGDWDESDLPPSLVRVYWNVRRRSSPALVGALTESLAGAGTSYSLKVAVGDRDVERPDRAVLYLAREAFAGATPAIRLAHRTLAGDLLPRVPRLTRRLAPGLALADDPGTGESSASIAAGSSRTRSAATAAPRTGRSGRRASSSTSPRRGSTRPDPTCAPEATRTPVAVDVATGRDTGFRAAAVEVGRRLVSEAVWHEDRCTWFGDDIEDDGAVIHRSLAADLYGGTSGVAWYLAHLFAATGDDDVAATAAGALRQALSRARARTTPGCTRARPASPLQPSQPAA